MKTEWINIKLNDGSEMRAYVARPANAAKAPAIMVFQEIYGVNAHIQDVAKRFAKLGFIAAAPDLFHRSEPGFAEENYNNREAARSYMQAYTSAHMATDIQGTYDWLSRQSTEISAIGYCLGGKLAFLANALSPLKCAISYYGGITTIIEQAKNQHGPLLMIWGGKDEHYGDKAPKEAAEAMKAAGKPYVNVTFSEANHGFFCDMRSAYHEESAKQSWALVKEFLI